MLNIFTQTFATGPSQALQEKWLLDYGEPDGRWKFNRLETWANSMDDEQKARDVVNAIGFLNRQ